MPARAYACPQSDHGVPLRGGPTPNVAVCTHGRAVRGTYGGQGKAAGFLVADGFAANPQMTTRRFPPPWTAEVTPNCFIVRDASGQALSYIYYESEPGRRSAAKLLTKDARRIAANIAKLPALGLDGGTQHEGSICGGAFSTMGCEAR